MTKALLRKALSARNTGALLTILILIGFYASDSKAQEAASGGTGAAITANIDANQIGTPVSKYEYGGFIEHIGSTMYSSLWSEMLDDRKFYFPISQTAK